MSITEGKREKFMDNPSAVVDEFALMKRKKIIITSLITFYFVYLRHFFLRAFCFLLIFFFAFIKVSIVYCFLRPNKIKY